MLPSKLRLRRLWRLANRSLYDWGTLDASSGKCCPVRDKATVECLKSKRVCPPKPSSYKCFERSSFTGDRYPLHLQEIYQRGHKPDPDCLRKLVRHDELYKPSDKCRRYQRTWPECPLIWLRPKDTCCPDPECCPPEKRRPRKPPQPPMSAIDRHLFQMSLICKYFTAAGCKPARHPPSCLRPRRPTDCCKIPAPSPSFSEVCRHLVPLSCRQECACLTQPSKCDVTHQRGQPKVCTKPLIGHRPRMRFPF